MKVNFDKIIKYLGYILAVFFLVLWGVAHLQNNKLTNQVQIQSVELMVQNDSTKVYKTKAGDYYAKFQAVGIESDNLKKSLEEMGVTNKELKARNIKQGDIISALEFKVKAMGEIIANVKDSVIHDTIPGKPDVVIPVIKWNDTHLYLNGYIQDKLFKGNYNYNLNLKSFVEQKGKSYVVTSYSPDKNVTITNGSQIIVQPKKTLGEKIISWAWMAAAFSAGHFLK